MDHGKVTLMRLLQYKNDLAVPTNAAIGPSLALRRAATSKNPTTCTRPSDVLSHNLIRHLFSLVIYFTLKTALIILTGLVVRKYGARSL